MRVSVRVGAWRFRSIDTVASDEPADLPVFPGPEPQVGGMVHESGEQPVGEQMLDYALHGIGTRGGISTLIRHVAADYTVPAAGDRA